MINSAAYSPDGKFLVVPSYRRDEPENKVPVTLIDELIERRLTSRDLENLLFVRSATAGKVTRKASASELVGEDLTGKTLGYYFRNYEDSEWMSTYNAIGIVAEDIEGYYKFLYPQQFIECGNDECEHEDWDDCSMDDLQGHMFRGEETILITEKETDELH